MRTRKAGSRKFLSLATAFAAFAGIAAPDAHAAEGLWDPPISVCDIQASREALLVRGFLILRSQGYLVGNPACPDKSVMIQNAGAPYRFMKQVDPNGERFGNPLGAGTWAEIDLRGSIAQASGRLTFSEVVRYERHDVIDSRWLSGASEYGPGPKERSFDTALVESPQPRRIEGHGFLLLADGTLSDAEVATLLALDALKNPET